MLFTTLCSGLGAALAAGIFSLLQYRLRRRDALQEQNDDERKALRYIMLYIIQERCKEHLSAGEISLEQLRSLHHWHKLYHEGLGGNGDADRLMQQVEALPLETQ